MANDMHPNTILTKNGQPVSCINPDINEGNQSTQTLTITDSNKQDTFSPKRDIRKIFFIHF